MGVSIMGAGAAVGSGAFSAAQINNREANIEVSADDAALIQLIPAHEYTSKRNRTVERSRVGYENGQLYVNFDDSDTNRSIDRGGGNGINRNSVYQVGALGPQAQQKMQEGIEDGVLEGPDPRDNVLYAHREVNEDPAFVIRNESDQEYEIELSYDAKHHPDPEEATGLLAMFSEDASGDLGSGGAAVLSLELGSPVSNRTTAVLAPGDEAFVALILETWDVDVSDPEENWHGTLRINVGEEAALEE